jgi:hypothetical protein
VPSAASAYDAASDANQKIRWGDTTYSKDNNRVIKAKVDLLFDRLCALYAHHQLSSAALQMHEQEGHQRRRSTSSSTCHASSEVKVEETLGVANLLDLPPSFFSHPWLGLSGAQQTALVETAAVWSGEEAPSSTSRSSDIGSGTNLAGGVGAAAASVPQWAVSQDDFHRRLARECFLKEMLLNQQEQNQNHGVDGGGGSSVSEGDGGGYGGGSGGSGLATSRRGGDFTASPFKRVPTNHGSRQTPYFLKSVDAAAPASSSPLILLRSRLQSPSTTSPMPSSTPRALLVDPRSENDEDDDSGGTEGVDWCSF